MMPSTRSALDAIRPANFSERCCQTCIYRAPML